MCWARHRLHSLSLSEGVAKDRGRERRLPGGRRRWGAVPGFPPCPPAGRYPRKPARYRRSLGAWGEGSTGRDRYLLWHPPSGRGPGRGEQM